jgi:hypothetical protein
MSDECRSCGAELEAGAYTAFGHEYCDNVCKQAAYRDRKLLGDRWDAPGARGVRRRNRDRRYRTKVFEGWERFGYSDGSLFHRGVKWDDVKMLFGGFVPEEQAELLLRDDRIRKLLAKALVTDSEDEASTALAIARRLHGKAP